MTTPDEFNAMSKLSREAFEAKGHVLSAGAGLEDAMIDLLATLTGRTPDSLAKIAKMRVSDVAKKLRKISESLSDENAKEILEGLEGYYKFRIQRNNAAHSVLPSFPDEEGKFSSTRLNVQADKYDEIILMTPREVLDIANKGRDLTLTFMIVKARAVS